MALITSDTIAFKTRPVSLTLAPESGPQLIKSTGKSVQAGKLEILSYTSHILGVKNNCKLVELPYAKGKNFSSKCVIEVIPSLPFLTCSIPEKENSNENCITDQSNKLEESSEDNQLKKKDNLKSIHNYPVKLYSGESKNLNLIKSNSSNDDPIELMNIKVSINCFWCFECNLK